MYKEIIYPQLAKIDAETVHGWTLNILAAAKYLPPRLASVLFSPFNIDDSRLAVKSFGLEFKNPIGLAAGFDKNAEAIVGLRLLGFGHVEVGTVTPLPQIGNDRPRIHRVLQFDSLVNSMGFPNHGAKVVEQNLKKIPDRKHRPAVGISVGPNKENAGNVDSAIADFVSLVTCLGLYGDYLAINVSSPNTPNLRHLGKKDFFEPLIEAVMQTRNSVRSDLPTLVKVSPDIGKEDFLNLLDVCNSYCVNGLIIGNTTLARPDFLGGQADLKGGLSGTLLRDQSDRQIKFASERTSLPIIGVGGVENFYDVVRKMHAGATLVQAYTGLIYEGPFFAAKINADLIHEMTVHGYQNFSELVASYI